MKVYAFRCTKDNPAENSFSWRVGDWQSQSTGNPTPEFRFAQVYSDQEAAEQNLTNLKMFNQWGIDFEMVEFVPDVDTSGCLVDALAEAGLDEDLAYLIRLKFERLVNNQRDLI